MKIVRNSYENFKKIVGKNLVTVLRLSEVKFGKWKEVPVKSYNRFEIYHLAYISVCSDKAPSGLLSTTDPYAVARFC